MDAKSKFLIYAPECDEALATALTEDGAECIKNFCHIDDVPQELIGVQANIALKYYNRMGQEGSKSYSEGGKAQSFDEILTPDIKRVLYGYRRLP